MLPDRPTPGCLLRRFTLGSGPVKRASDRLECLARVLLVVSLLTAVPVSLAVATATYTQASAQATAQAADRYRVTARLLEDASAPAGAAWSSQQETWSNLEEATAVWTDPAGGEHRAPASVPPGAKAGTTVTLWIDRDGNRTTRPLGDGHITGLAVDRGIVTFAGLAVIAWGGYRSFRTLLDRSRSRRWAADWAVVEPVWSRMVW
jgi:hypothetical protein